MWLFTKGWAPLNIPGAFNPLGFLHADTAQGVFSFHLRLFGKATSFRSSRGRKVSCFEMGVGEMEVLGEKALQWGRDICRHQTSKG